MKNRMIVGLAVLTLVMGCGKSSSPTTPTAVVVASPVATPAPTPAPAPPPTPTPAPPAPTIRTFTLAGVVNDLSGRAVRSATVTATDSSNTARGASTDGNGYFSIAPLREGSVQLLVSASGFVSSTRTVSLTSDLRIDTTLVDVAPPPPTAGTPAPPTGSFRTGARCKDGTTSTATGSGACSSHGGVACWIYNDGSCRAS